MTQQNHYIYLSILAFLIGGFFCGIERRWLVWVIGNHSSYHRANTDPATVIKTVVPICVWSEGAWHAENREIITQTDEQKHLFFVLTGLMTLMYEEQIIAKKVSVESVIISDDDQLIISFDRNPLDKQWSTHRSLMLIESLLKTLRHNGCRLQKIVLCLNHRPLKHGLLDFSSPWPLQGFTEKLA